MANKPKIKFNQDPASQNPDTGKAIVTTQHADGSTKTVHGVVPGTNVVISNPA